MMLSNSFGFLLEILLIVLTLIISTLNQIYQFFTNDSSQIIYMLLPNSNHHQLCLKVIGIFIIMANYLASIHKSTLLLQLFSVRKI